MGENERQTVGERGQISIPKELRRRFGINVGDEVVVRESDEGIRIESGITREELAEGYRKRAERESELAVEFDSVSREADSLLGDAPDCSTNEG